jgi:hypothetical protein
MGFSDYRYSVISDRRLKTVENHKQRNEESYR